MRNTVIDRAELWLRGVVGRRRLLGLNLIHGDGLVVGVGPVALLG